MPSLDTISPQLRIRREWDGKELLLSEHIMLEAFEDIGMERLCVDKFDCSCYNGF